MVANFLLFLFLCISLSGCVKYQWQKNGANEAETNKNINECTAESLKLFPHNLVSKQINAGTNMQVQIETTDVNAKSRDKSVSDCMYERGWKLISGE